MKTKNILILILTLMIAAYTGLTLAETFQGPVDIPANYNASAPINVSSTGQLKEGWLKLTSGFVVGTEDNPTIYAYGAVGGSYDNKVGIGTKTPSAKLDIKSTVSGPGGWHKAINFSDSSHAALTLPAGNLLFGLHSNGNFYWGHTKNGGADFDYYDMYLERHDLLINKDEGIILSPEGNNHTWHINPYDSGTDLEFFHTGGGNGNKITFTQNAEVRADAYLYNSDRRLKKDIQKLENYKDILKIDAVRFNWKKTGKADVGIIAQEVQKYFPEFVKKSGDYLAVDYPKLAVPMLNLLQEQEKRLDKQGKEIQELRKMIERLVKRK